MTQSQSQRLGGRWALGISMKFDRKPLRKLSHGKRKKLGKTKKTKRKKRRRTSLSGRIGRTTRSGARMPMTQRGLYGCRAVGFVSCIVDPVT